VPLWLSGQLGGALRMRWCWTRARRPTGAATQSPWSRSGCPAH